MPRRKRLLMVSHVPPLPRTSGQRQRVYHMLRAARERFHVTFAGLAPPGAAKEARERLAEVADASLLLPSRYAASAASKAWHRMAGTLFALRTGVKLSNYVIGELEFAPSRLAEATAGQEFDCVLLEYWHASGIAGHFRARGIPCVLDLHDVVWRARERELAGSRLPVWWRERSLGRYRAAEERAWERFDGLIAINRDEEAYLRERVADRARVFWAPMGVDLEAWPFAPAPATPPRIAFYGGLSSGPNRAGASRLVRAVMPAVWRRFPDAECWLVGGDPAPELRAMARDPRVRVPGFVEDAPELLRTMTAVACPWEGRYGFRSRLIEVMALGVPVVVSPDAISGMELAAGAGVLVGRDDAGLAARLADLLGDRALAARQGIAARATVERALGLDTTYRRLFRELEGWLDRGGVAS
ncbi:MAG: glycosyltransferase family 4 protein [Planctomycetaceae bacterium]